MGAQHPPKGRLLSRASKTEQRQQCPLPPLVGTAPGAHERRLLASPRRQRTPDPGGRSPSTAPVRRSRGAASFYGWPAETRKVTFAAEARLHARCVIADAASALVPSVNLTSVGINDNIGLGVVIDGGALPHNLHEHFAHLIDSEQLQPADVVIGTLPCRCGPADRGG